MLAEVPADLLEQIRLGIPLGRLAEVDDIVPSYVFLASEDGRHYQGQCISPNGGDVFLQVPGRRQQVSYALRMITST